MAEAAEPRERPEQLMAQLEVVQRELQRMDRRMAAIEQQMLETQQAVAAVEALGQAGADQEGLVPLGAGVHVRARFDGTAPVLLPIGAGYSTEAPAAEVAKALAARVQAIQQAFESASEEAEQLAHAAGAIQDRLSQLSPAGMV